GHAVFRNSRHRPCVVRDVQHHRRRGRAGAWYRRRTGGICLMDEIRDLYQEVILDHNKNPRNFHRMDDADAVLEGYNPLCGDHYTFFVKFDGDRIDAVSFDGSGCAISKASASIMSAALKGRTRAEAERLFELFT